MAAALRGGRVTGLAGLVLFAALFLTARRAGTSVPAGPRALGSLALPAVFIGSVAAFNYAANPFGLFPTRLFEPIVLHSRADKLRLYAAREPAPEVVVFGSSPGFTVAPAHIERLTGRPAFNASLHGGTPRDFLAFTRYMVASGRTPRVAIVELRVEQFRPDARVGFEPGDPLESWAEEEDPGPLRSAEDRARTLLTLEQTEASLRLLRVELEGRSEPHYWFDPDGLGHFKAYSAGEAIDAYLLEAAKPHHFRFRALSEYHLGQLERFLDLCRERGIRVIVYIPPYHPRLAALWERETRLPELKAQFLRRLAGEQHKGGVSVHDFSRLESFGGAETMFKDALHVDEEASRRMLDIMLRDVS
jgi:hypothetical protein